MKILEHGCRRSFRAGGGRPVLVWDRAMSERYERLYDETIDQELRSRRRAQRRREFKDE